MLILKERLDGEPRPGRRVFTNRFRRTAPVLYGVVFVLGSFYNRTNIAKDKKIQRDQDSDSLESARRSTLD
jgi:hypothetical protein